MQISKIINDIFRQDFSNKAVLGRTFFGLGIMLLGLLNLLQIESYASYAPGFLPFAGFFVVLVGAIYFICGLLVIGNMHMKHVTLVLSVMFALFIVVVYLPQQWWSDLLVMLSMLGATVMMYAASVAKEEETSTEEK